MKGSLGMGVPGKKNGRIFAPKKIFGTDKNIPTGQRVKFIFNFLLFSSLSESGDSNHL